MRNSLKYTIIIPILFLCSCNNRSYDKYFGTHIFNINHKIIGDSLFVNSQLRVINFSDSSLEVDSINFLWYANANLKAKITMKRGKNVFENLEYYPNGLRKTFKFFYSTGELKYAKYY